MNTTDQNTPDSLTIKKAKKESLWQVYIPIALFAVLIIIAAVLVALNINQNSTGLRHWADLSTILVILPVMVMSLFLFILLIGLIIAISYLIKALPKAGLRVQGFSAQIFMILSGISDLFTRPVIQLKSVIAMLQGMLLSLIGKSKRG